MRSLRARLSVAIALALTVLLAGSGVVIYLLVEARMYRELDSALLAIAQASRGRVERELARLARDGRPGPPGRGRPEPPFWDDYRVAVHGDDSQLLMSSESLGDGDLPVLATAVDEPVHANIELPDGTPARAVAWRFVPRAPPRGREPPGGRRRPPPQHTTSDAPPVEIVVAGNTESLTATLTHLRWLLALTWVGAGLGGAAVVAWLVHQGLGPLAALGQQIRGFDENRLEQRFAVDAAPTELEPVLEQLNALMGRLAAAFEREQSFTSYAAHELRTPLAGLRATLELALSRERSSEELRTSAARCLDITEQMQSLVESLLELTRMQAEGVTSTRSPVRLAAVVAECQADQAGRVGERQLTVATHGDSDLKVTTDPTLFRRVLGNLLENAVEYAPGGATVQVDWERNGSGVRLAVSNPVDEVQPELAQRAFEVFWRGDRARSDTGKHAGLGLAICSRIVDVLGGSIDASVRDSTFTVSLLLP